MFDMQQGRTTKRGKRKGRGVTGSHLHYLDDMDIHVQTEPSARPAVVLWPKVLIVWLRVSITVPFAGCNLVFTVMNRQTAK